MENGQRWLDTSASCIIIIGLESKKSYKNGKKLIFQSELKFVSKDRVDPQDTSIQLFNIVIPNIIG